MTYLLIFVPFIALIIFNLSPKGAREKVAFWLTLLIFLGEVVVAFLSPLGLWSRIILANLEPIFGFNLFIDNLSAVLLLTLGIVGFTTLLVSRFTVKNENQRFNLMNLLMVALIGMNGISMVTDIFSLYVCIEITAVATFILITLYKDREALEGVLKYLILSVIGSILLLSSISLLLMVSGGTSFSMIRIALTLNGNNFLAQTAVALFIGGLFIKGGLVPFHGWVPDAYSSAPAAISIFLAGIVSKASGIFPLIRLTAGVIGGSDPLRNILLIVGTISIVVGALAALGQKDMKRMLAYSSISQVGYIVIGLGAGTSLGIVAAVFHFFNHAIFKSQLFANSAAVEEQLGTRDMSKMGGLAEKMTVTGTTSVIASLSAAGIPPLAGFWSKLLIILALWVSGHYVYSIIAVLASVITLAYFLYWQRTIFFGKVPPELEQVREAPAGLIFPAIVLSSITVGVGLIFPFLLNIFVR